MITFYCLRFETSQPEGPDSRIYNPQEHGGPVISPGIGFPFHRLLRATLEVFEPAFTRDLLCWRGPAANDRPTDRTAGQDMHVFPIYD
jgi:hypothetical protein